MSRALFAALLVLVIACGAPARVATPPVGAAPRFAFDDVESVNIDWSRPVPSTEPARITLATTDGHALDPKSVDARAAIYGPLAFTELHLAFATTLPKVDDAILTLNLPRHASLARVALRIGDAWQEAEVVDRPDAGPVVASDDSRPIDVDLRAMFAPPPVRIHLFPVRGARTEIVVAYTELLHDDYRLLLHELPSLDALDVNVLVPAEKKAYVLHRTREAPGHDLALAVRHGDIDVVRSGDFAVVRVEPPPAKKEPIDGAVLLIDTSASRAKTYDPDLSRLSTAFGRERLTIATFDQEVVPVATIAEAKSRRPGGATDYAKALAWAKAHGKRAIVYTDGRGAKLESSGLERVDAIGAGESNLEGLRALTRSGASPGSLVLPDEDPTLVTTASTRWTSRLEINGLPQRIEGRVTFAFLELPGGLPISVGIDGAEARPVTSITAPTVLVERAVLADRLAQLPRPDKDLEIAKIAKRHRIPTAVTSFHFLGTAEEYAKHKVPEDDHILVVNESGAIPRMRGPAPGPTPRPADAPPNLPPPAIPALRGTVVIDSDYDYILQRIAFAHGSSELEGQGPLLDSTVRMMGVKDDVDVLGVYGHTDDNEDPALGQVRAELVRDELVKRGFDARRLVVKNWGATKPLEPAKTAEAREKNRRVEFRALAAYGRATGVEDSVPMPLLVRSDGKIVRFREPYTGRLAEVMKSAEAAAKAEAWVDEDRADRLAWIALGLATADKAQSARAFGSLVDLASTPEDLRSAAGFLESVGAFDLAVAAYTRANDTTPNALRLLAWALARQGKLDAAFETIVRAANQHFDAKRWPGIDKVFARDVGLLAAMLARGKSTTERSDVFRRAKAAGAVGLELRTHFAVLTWEADADLDIVGAGDPARPLLSPANDVARSGPELLLLDTAHPNLEVHLIRQEHARPIAGKVMVFTHDGRGNVEVADLPFVMNVAKSRIALPTH